MKVRQKRINLLLHGPRRDNLFISNIKKKDFNEGIEDIYRTFSNLQFLSMINDKGEISLHNFNTYL